MSKETNVTNVANVTNVTGETDELDALGLIGPCNTYSFKLNKLLLDAMCAAAELEYYKQEELNKVRGLSKDIECRDKLVVFYATEVDKTHKLKEALRKEFLGEDLYRKFTEA